MSEIVVHPTPEILKRFHPLDQLNDIQLELLGRSIQIHSAGRGLKIVEQGDTTPFSIYLIKGKLRLLSSDGRITEIVDDSAQAENPIANLIPRRYTVEAISPTDYLMVDNSLLEGLLNTDDGYTATEIESDSQVVDPLVAENRMTEVLLDDLNNNCLVLPSLPDVAIRVGRAMRDETTNARKLANIVQTDPAITTKLVRAANSPLYAGVTPVDSCAAAIVRLGADTTHKLVLTFALRELFNTRSSLLKEYMRSLWEHSVKVSAVCYILAKISGRFNPEHALLAGLLHDIGNVAILSYAENFTEVANDPEKLERVMHDMRGRIGSAILRSWGFIDDLIEVTEEAENWFRDHQGEADYADLVIVSQLHTYIGSEEMRQLPTLDKVPAVNRLELGELTPKLSLKILDKAEEKIVHAQQMLTA
ncbi:MAG: HDOD domain-containing protein [Candidatus Thiodiazotropha sp.]|nr:HDOD domain-containing protein [Candidatus Thiodiazotropha sp. (ex Lucina pensylvanica)]MBT3064636.1 HDOD domain-containing protein [Candidatus Thiodiazotropha sp. (ex Lucina pensylvanica)]MBV2095767.1 HDOD domain-containing protein [Candidatus Thiodiazotropha sp. (ex Codakia orbicularis)]PUB74582.1 MAG: cyclic nucleotide-binding protein [gamma proteobacterium symbiont of Ctena orbiculata]PUB76399.1 MAG: cyclic nucleotide-binding protein [gamma proteobacterium symbiont of Ctena orbiculata]